jgi:hypothetical protein
MPKEARDGKQRAARLPSRDGDARAKVEAFVREQSPAHQKTINRLRVIVKSAAPELEEKMRWRQVGYLVSKKDVCGIYPAGDHVNLSFWLGSTLRDPDGLLEGTGKGMRHVKVFRVEDVGEETVKAYVREAVASVQRS